MICCRKCDGYGCKQRADGSWWCDNCWDEKRRAEAKALHNKRARDLAPEMAEALRELVWCFDPNEQYPPNAYYVATALLAKLEAEG